MDEKTTKTVEALTELVQPQIDKEYIVARAEVQIFDGIGLDESLIHSAIDEIGDFISYHRIKKIDFHKIAQKSIANEDRLFVIVLMIDLAVLETVRATIPQQFLEQVVLVPIATPRQLEEFPDSWKLVEMNYIFDILETPISKNKMLMLLKKIEKHVESRAQFKKMLQEIDSQAEALKKLNDIGIALSAETDIHNLLDLILTISMDITSCDSGSLYIVQEVEGINPDKNNYLKNKQLCFKHTYNFTKSIPFKEFTMPISDKSLSGYTALTGQTLNLEDVYVIPEERPYHFNKSFDEYIKYRTKSMLVVPMLNREKNTIGVIQLINKKLDRSAKLDSEEHVNTQVIPFTKKDEELTLSFASQAAVAYENRSLYESIKTLFEGFIKASVTAIEARDPTTSGHSGRVAKLSVGTAQAVNRINTGRLSGINFTDADIQELNYASLLHDFGKIGVREPVLVKSKKLYDPELEILKMRYDILKRSYQLNITEQKVKYLLDKSREEALPLLDKLDHESQNKLAELDQYLDFIVKINEPTVLESSGFELLSEIKQKTFENIPFLTDYESMRLSIPRGSLGNDERLEIESHVTHTFNFLRQIPWTNQLRNVPDIAYMHHEKLDGSGYPNKVPADVIPPQTRIMTIADIYDALTASDRPYKRAVPTEKALDILGYEVKAKKVDEDLFNVFVEAKVYEVIKEPETTEESAG